jgi:diguanylate cyclase (GGDEF)-like protein
MTNWAMPTTTWEIPPRLRALAVRLRGLIEPAAMRSEPELRRARVLAAMTLVLLVSLALFLLFIFISVSDSRLPLYVTLMVSLMALFVLALGLNQAGRYQAAAGLIVACTTFGVWSAIAFDLATLRSHSVTMSYIVVPVILCSFLLSTRVTVVLAAAQLAVVCFLPLFSPVMAGNYWPSLISFILFISVLSVVSNFISRRDLKQIDRQTRQLVEDEVQLRKLSVSDPLTGLFNLRYLEKTLLREVRRAERNQAPLAVVMLDLDQFKRINDGAGHAIGDRILRELSNILSANTRDGDVACRYGGDEFVLILPDCTLDHARQKMEFLREQVKHLVVQIKGDLLDGLTVSIGVAAFPDHGASAEGLLKAADDALYRAKQTGRDRVAA